MIGKNENFSTEEPITTRIPVFKRQGDRMSCRYARSYINGAAEKLAEPLTAEEVAALDYFDTGGAP